MKKENKISKKALMTALAFTVSSGIQATAFDDAQAKKLFSLNELGNSQVLIAEEGACGEGACGSTKEEAMTDGTAQAEPAADSGDKKGVKKKGKKKKDNKEQKDGEGHCGSHKDGEGACGANKDAATETGTGSPE